MPSPSTPPRVRVVARSLYRGLVSEGLDDRQVLAIATELIGAVTTRLAEARRESGEPRP